MSVVFAVVAFIIMLTIGGIGIVAGIIGILSSRKMIREGKERGKIIKIISILVIIFSVVIALVPLVFMGIIICMNVMPPSDFVETGVVIEENGYQDERFTVKGVVYEALEYEGCNVGTLGTPVFEYRTKGLLNGSQCGNYYALENQGKFNIVGDRYGRLFCPTDEKQKVLEYYGDFNKAVWLYGLGIPDKKFTEHASEELIQIAKVTESDLQRETVFSSNTDLYYITAVSEDGILYLCHYNLAIIDDGLLYVFNAEKVAGGMEYEVIRIPKEASLTVLRELRR